jgi:hypothetical protein
MSHGGVDPSSLTLPQEKGVMARENTIDRETAGFA